MAPLSRYHNPARLALVLITDLRNRYPVPARGLNRIDRDSRLDRRLLVGSDNRSEMLGALADDFDGPAGHQRGSITEHYAGASLVFPNAASLFSNSLIRSDACRSWDLKSMT